jgi:hypothetical protein
MGWDGEDVEKWKSRFEHATLYAAGLLTILSVATCLEPKDYCTSLHRLINHDGCF